VIAGGCPARYQAPTFVVRNTSDVCTLAGNGTAVTTALGAGSPNYACLHGRMESATMWLGIAGFCISAIMLQRRVKVRCCLAGPFNFQIPVTLPALGVCRGEVAGDCRVEGHTMLQQCVQVHMVVSNGNSRLLGSRSASMHAVASISISASAWTALMCA
jgi:hypothetical protein